MGIFWLIWNEKGRTPTHKHMSEASAKAEAERLARLQPGDTFHVLQCIGSCRKIDVEWTDHVCVGEIVPEEQPDRTITAPEWSYIKDCLRWLDVTDKDLLDHLKLTRGSQIKTSMIDDIKSWMSLIVDKRNAA